MIKVLVVDNHPIVTTGFKLLFENHEDIRVVGTVSSGVDIFEFVRRNEVDVIISEIELPELNGITALRAMVLTQQRAKPGCVSMIAIAL